MVIQTAHGLDVHGIRKAFKRAQRKIDTRVVIVDYLQMIPGSDKKPRHEQLEESMIEFAALAATEKVAMVVLSQLNRESTKRDMNGGGSSVPRLSDLRGSGSIEQVGKLIIALHTLDHTLDTLGLYVLKNSQGRRGNVTVGFERQYCDIG
jgi:replicative DNA helicase